ncbi:MAG: hypothetical protein ACE37H_14980 [Phycisphaeraceae bacterium]
MKLTTHVRTAWRERQESPAPAMARIVALAGSIASACIVLSVLIRPEDQGKAFNFYDERGSVTALSAILLASAGAWAIAAFLIAPWPQKRYRLFWLIAGCAFLLLSADELMQFHEKGGAWLYQHTALSKLVDEQGFRNLNDLIVILYGVVAIPVGVLLLPGLVRVPRVLELLAVAFLFYVLHTAIDSLSEPPTNRSMVLEESAKLMSSCFISLSMLSGLLGAALQAKADQQRLTKNADAV